MAESGLRGTTAAQDTRFKDKEAAAVKATSFPEHFSQKVDLRKVNVSVLKPWIAQKVTDMIRLEDDVVVEYVIGMLEDKEKPIPDPKKMQVNLLGFMDKYGAAAFMDQLWSLLLSAQKTVGGVPAEFIAAKKAELERQQMYARTDNKYASRDSQNQNRASAEDSFGIRRSDDRGLPPRPDGRDGRDNRGGYRRSPPPGRDGRDRDRDDGYGRRGGGPRRFDDRPRDSGYGQRRPPSPDRYRRRSPSPPPRRRSPSPPPRRRSPPPRRRSPSPRRQPQPERQRERSITPPLRTRRDSPSRATRTARDDTPPRRRSPSDSPPPPVRAQRGRSRSRTPTPHDSRDSRSRSRSRSPTVTPPRRRQESTPPRERTRRRSSTPPRHRRDPVSQSPPAKRRRDDRAEDEVVKKGRGFAREDEEAAIAEPAKRKLDGPLAKSKWA